MIWHAHYICGIFGCEDSGTPYDPACPRCGCGIYDYGYVEVENSALGWMWFLERNIRAKVKNLFTTQRCYGPCHRVLSWRNRYGHCGDPNCDDIPF